MEKILIQESVFALIPKRLEDCYELPPYLVNECYRLEIKTPVALIQEFSKPKSILLNGLESVNIAKLADILIVWELPSPITCTLLQNYQFSKN